MEFAVQPAVTMNTVQSTATSAPAAEAAPAVESKTDAAKPADGAAPAAPAATETPAVVDKPGRRAAAARKAEGQAQAAKADADKRAATVAEAEAKVKAYQDAIASGDVDAMMKAFGITDEKLGDLYIAKHGSAGEPDKSKVDKVAIDEVNKKLGALEKELADRKAADADAALKQQVAREVSAVKATADAAADKYIAIANTPTVNDPELGPMTPHEVAFMAMVRVHQETGKRITHAEALDAVEATLREQAKAEYARLGKIVGGAPAAHAEKTAPAASESSDPLERMRSAFKSTRPRLTNASGTSHPAAAQKQRGMAAADQRMRDKIAALVAGRAN